MIHCWQHGLGFSPNFVVLSAQTLHCFVVINTSGKLLEKTPSWLMHITQSFNKSQSLSGVSGSNLNNKLILSQNFNLCFAVYRMEFRMYFFKATIFYGSCFMQWVHFWSKTIWFSFLIEHSYTTIQGLFWRFQATSRCQPWLCQSPPHCGILQESNLVTEKIMANNKIEHTLVYAKIRPPFFHIFGICCERLYFLWEKPVRKFSSSNELYFLLFHFDWMLVRELAILFDQIPSPFFMA